MQKKIIALEDDLPAAVRLVSATASDKRDIKQYGDTEDSFAGGTLCDNIHG